MIIPAGIAASRNRQSHYDENRHSVSQRSAITGWRTIHRY